LRDAAPVAYGFAGIVRCGRSPLEMPMSDTTAVALSPETVLAQMKQNGVTDVVWLPDSETKRLMPLTARGAAAVKPPELKVSAGLAH